MEGLTEGWQKNHQLALKRLRYFIIKNLEGVKLQSKYKEWAVGPYHKERHMGASFYPKKTYFRGGHGRMKTGSLSFHLS